MQQVSKPLVTGRFSEAEKARMADLAGRFVPGRIAGMLNRSQQSVYFFMVTHGLYVPAKRKRRASGMRNGQEVRSFTDAEDRFIVALREGGLNCVQIARQAGLRFGYERSHNTIRCRLKMLAVREEADAAG